MKIKLETKKLQDLVTKAMKGSSNNKMIPITSLMSIKAARKKLFIKTTDATNYLYVFDDLNEDVDFDVVVQAELFAKLISKITDKDVTLEVIEGTLYVKGNGVYKIELPLDEEGELITYPSPDRNLDNAKKYTVEISDIKTIISTAKSALATTIENPCYTGYYLGKKVIATDTFMICGIDIELFDEPVLMSPELMNLIDLCEDDVSVYISGLDITVESKNVRIVGKLMDSIDDYSVEAINSLLSAEFESVCKVNRNSFLQLLDRLSLFVGVYDKNEITLTFSNNDLTVVSKQVNSTESIEYVSSVNFKPFTCVIDITMLQSQVKANSGETIEIGYGLDNAIRIVDGDVTQIIALQE